MSELIREYLFKDLYIGLTESFNVQITDKMMNHFVEITSDINPLHMNQEYARSKGFDSQVVYGMLTASFISTLGGVYIPGKYCIIQEVEIKFSKPVYVGDLLTLTGTVKELFSSVKRAHINVEIYNQHTQKILKGILKVGVLK